MSMSRVVSSVAALLLACGGGAGGGADAGGTADGTTEATGVVTTVGSGSDPDTTMGATMGGSAASESGTAGDATTSDTETGGTMTQAVALSVAGDDACTLDEEGQLRCWGTYLAEQTGWGAMGTAWPAPTPIAEGTPYKFVATAPAGRCVLAVDDTLWCSFFDNVLFQIGTETWSQYAIAGTHECGIKTSGALECAGPGPAGMLQPFTDDNAWVAVEVSNSHGCAIRDEGSLWCWGRNDNGELGIGDRVTALLPVQVGAESDWTWVSAGTGRTCGVRAPGTLWCWGLALAQSPVSGSSPVQVGRDANWETVDVEAVHACALRATGEVECWGNNDQGQLGDGTRIDRGLPAPVGEDSDWAAVDVGFAHSCARKQAGDVWCWGANNEGQLGYGAAGDKTWPWPVSDDGGWSSVSAADDEVCAIRDATVYCWGRDPDDSQEIRLATEMPIATPASVVERGERHGCAITTSGALYCWGDADQGALGIGPNPGDFVAAPTQAGNEETWTAITLGEFHTCGLQGGTLWCWGSNGYGQLGLGLVANQFSPMQVIGFSDWTAVAAGPVTTCAIRQGDLYCWGDEYTDVPELVDAAGDWAMLSLGAGDGDDSITGLKDDGSLWFLGSGQIGSDTDWADLESAFSSYCAVKTDGRLFCDYSQLGAKDDPIQIGPDGGFAQVTFHQTFGCLVSDADELYCWGRNPVGQHGDDSVRRLVPVATQ